jgi:hypothetical protein
MRMSEVYWGLDYVNDVARNPCWLDRLRMQAREGTSILGAAGGIGQFGMRFKCSRAACGVVQDL